MSFTNFLRRQVRRQVKRHQIFHIRVDLLQACFIFQCLLGRGDGRFEIGLNGREDLELKGGQSRVGRVYHNVG